MEVIILLDWWQVRKQSIPTTAFHSHCYKRCVNSKGGGCCVIEPFGVNFIGDFGFAYAVEIFSFLKRASTIYF